MQDSENAYSMAVSTMERLIAKVKDPKSTALKSCIAGLYSADDSNPLRFSGKMGMLQIDYDREFKTHFIRFYNIDTLTLLLQVEMYYGFGDNFRRCKVDSELFIFDFFADGVIGFQFRTKSEAQEIEAKIKSVSPKKQQFVDLMKSRTKRQIEEKKQSSIFGKMKKKIFGFMGEEEHNTAESVVLRVQKQKSVEINLQTGQLDFENVPPEWQQILKGAGLKKQDLKDKQIAKLVIQQTILHTARKLAEQTPHEVTAKQLNMIKEENDDNQTQAGSQISDMSNPCLPPPPDPSFLNLIPPPSAGLLAPTGLAGRGSTNRADLMDQIRKNNLKLKPVKHTEKGMELDASAMNKQERKELSEHLRTKLKRRMLALNRRKGSDEQEDDE